MELSSNLIHFVLFSALAAGAFRLCPKSLGKYLLLALNVLFYTLCSAKYLVFMLLAALWSYYSAIRISRDEERPVKWLYLGVAPIIAMLALFKYWMPFLELLDVRGQGCLALVLPLGMSYYILKSLSYLFDVYRKKIQVERDLVAYMGYVTFFAQIIAGPIQRYEQWSQNIRQHHYKVTAVDGYYHIVQGLFMKVVIANRIGDYAMQAFLDPVQVNGLQLWLSFFLYAFYIYFDFAGYSNIAIGVTQCFGIDCIRNFNRPYLSINNKDFWSRWHISLSTWLRDYVYIPLGGNRLGRVRKCVNVMITFLVSGMWHGSTFNFVVWGAYHGVLNSWNYRKRDGLGVLAQTWRIGLNFILVSIGWVFFATPTLSHSLAFFQGMLGRLTLDMASIQQAILPFTMDNTCLSFFLVASFYLVVALLKEMNDEFRFLTPHHPLYSFLWQVFLLASVMLFGIFENTSFIYAGF